MGRNFYTTIFFTSVFFLSESSEAQINFGQLQDQHTFTQASEFMPSLIGEGIRKYKITFFDFYGAASNSSFSLGAIENSLSSENFTDSILKYVKPENNIYAGANFSLLNVSFNVKKKSQKKFLSFSLGIRERADMNFVYNKNLISLLLQGNKQFAGETVNLAPLSVNFLQCTDYYFGMKTQLDFKTKKKLLLKIKPAVQFHYLTSMANVYSKKSELSLFTAEDGRELNLNYDYNLYVASPADDAGTHGLLGNVGVKDITKNLFSGVRSGKAFDFGLGIDVNEWFKMNAALTDVGAITFKNHANNYSGTGEINFTGFDVSLTETQNSFHSQLDSLLQIMKPEAEATSYSVPLATKFFSNVSLNLLKKRKKNSMAYFRHRFNLTFIQGMKNYLNASTTPLVALGYNYSIGNIINAGVVVAKSYAGNNAGANLSFQLGHYQLWCNSNNLLPLIDKQSAKGIDGSVGMGMEF